MKSYHDQAAKFIEVNVDKESKAFVDNSLDISLQIFDLLKSKEWSQKDLAESLNKSEAEISKWLSGLHNLTLKSISKMEAALDSKIITTPLKKHESIFKVKYLRSIKNASNNNAQINHSYNQFKREGQLLKLAI